MIKLLNLFTILLLLSSCRMGYVEVEKSIAFASENFRSKKVICVNPEIDSYKMGGSTVVTAKQVSKAKKNSYRKSIKKMGKKNGIDFEIISAEQLNQNDTDYFNVILRLKSEILESLSLQKPVLSDEENKLKGLKKLFNPKPKIIHTKWEVSPIISSEYSYLAEKYGTPYFNIQGVFHLKQAQTNIALLMILPLALVDLIQNYDHCVFYNILIDVEKSEIVFRELRISERRARKGVISPMLYESYYMMTNN